jgi:hypothetical protein
MAAFVNATQRVQTDHRRFISQFCIHSDIHEHHFEEVTADLLANCLNFGVYQDFRPPSYITPQNTRHLPFYIRSLMYIGTNPTKQSTCYHTMRTLASTRSVPRRPFCLKMKGLCETIFGVQLFTFCSHFFGFFLGKVATMSIYWERVTRESGIHGSTYSAKTPLLSPRIVFSPQPY